jgi:hypothetical protein
MQKSKLIDLLKTQHHIDLVQFAKKGGFRDPKKGGFRDLKKGGFRGMKEGGCGLNRADRRISGYQVDLTARLCVYLPFFGRAAAFWRWCPCNARSKELTGSLV